MFTIKMSCIIIIQLRALFSDISPSQKGVYLTDNPLITFFKSLTCWERKKKVRVRVQMTQTSSLIG